MNLISLVGNTYIYQCGSVNGPSQGSFRSNIRNFSSHSFGKFCQNEFSFESLEQFIHTEGNQGQKKNNCKTKISECPVMTDGKLEYYQFAWNNLSTICGMELN